MSIVCIALLFIQVQLATASGIVTRPGGIEPLSGALVTLTPVASSQSARTRTATSEDDGRFTLSNIEPGEYRIQIQSARYGSAAYGQRKPNGPGAILNIAAGQRLSDLKVSMLPTGTIAGRITGSGGEPLANASVQALKYSYLEGRRVLSLAQTATTDDRGEYRLFWLTAGKYIVVAGPRSQPLSAGNAGVIRPGESLRAGDLPFVLQALTLTPDALMEGANQVSRILEDGTVRQESWLPTYYPSSIDPAQATPVEVSLGATVPGIDITLGPSPVQKIRGRVTGIAPGSQATVALAPVSQGSIGRLINKGASTLDSSFEFAGVVPGPYYLTAQDRSGLASRPMAVVVVDRDVENLSIGLAPSVTVRARITIEGMTAESIPQGPLGALTGLSGMLRPKLDTPFSGPLSNLGPRSAQFTSGNVMVFSNVPPGDYLFDISQGTFSGPQGTIENARRLHIKSVRLGREDVFETLRIASGEDVLIDVLLTTETGAVDGVALGRAGDPLANATVVLIPTDARNRTSRYKAVVTGSDGKFRFQEVPPGDYKVFAWDDVETGAWENAEFMRPYEARGRAVRVSEKSKDEVQVDVIYNP
jgi:hypothetical protein